MRTSGIEAAFAHYGAKLKNRMWAVSTLTDDDVVMSLWQHRFKGPLYSDSLSRWSGPGNSLFRQHLQQAWDERRIVRVVVAITSDPEAVNRGEDASKFSNTYRVRDEVIGAIESFDGDNFQIRIRFADTDR